MLRYSHASSWHYSVADAVDRDPGSAVLSSCSMEATLKPSWLNWGTWELHNLKLIIHCDYLNYYFPCHIFTIVSYLIFLPTVSLKQHIHFPNAIEDKRNVFKFFLKTSLGTLMVKELHWLIPPYRRKPRSPHMPYMIWPSLTSLCFFPTVFHYEPSILTKWIFALFPNESTQFQSSASNTLLFPPEMVSMTTHLENWGSFFKTMFRTSPLRPRTRNST